MREVSEHDLTLSQLKTLSLLGELPPSSPLSLKDVAERLGISLPAASRAVDPLVRRGLAERREDTEDRRIKRVRITPKGDALGQRLMAARVAALRGAALGVQPSPSAESSATRWTRSLPGLRSRTTARGRRWRR